MTGCNGIDFRCNLFSALSSRRRFVISLEDFDVAIVGGGPSGLAAAIVASAGGLKTVLLEERVSLGGQIYKQLGTGFVVDPKIARLGKDYDRGTELINAAKASDATILTDCIVASIDGMGITYSVGESPTQEITARNIIIASGAADRAIVFPGWTLPGVFTAGGAQTLVKTQKINIGSKVVFAGSGPLALAFPSQLSGYGVNLVQVLESGPAPRATDIVKILGAVPGNIHLLVDAARYRWNILRKRVPLSYGRIVVRAEGDGCVERVVHAASDKKWNPIPGTEQTIEADGLCLGYGFSPSVEALRLLGCEFTLDEDLGGLCVAIDENCKTSVPHVWAVGDGAGVEGVYVAMAQGKIAAINCLLEEKKVSQALAQKQIADQQKKIRQKRKLVRATNRMYRFGDGAYSLATESTIVCRCEEVTVREIDIAMQYGADTMSIKSLTRAGMGLCQGRNCQRHIAARIASKTGINVKDIPMSTPRLPLRPIALGRIADSSVVSEKFFTLGED